MSKQRHVNQRQSAWRTLADYEICECGKRGYRTRADAKGIAKLWHGTGRSKEKQRIYQCDHSGWHLTSQDAATREYYKSHA